VEPDGSGVPAREVRAWLFEEQVEKSAEAAALVYEDVVLTYAELNEERTAWRIICGSWE